VQLLSATPLITLYNLEQAWSDPAARTSARRDHRTARRSRSADRSRRRSPRGSASSGFLDGLGLGEPARNVFIRTAYDLLDLISFLTAGPDECRAWPIRRGTIARKAAGKVHSDIERGFIRAEIYRVDDLRAVGTEAALKAQGKLRVEGKEYVMADGDVVNFRFNV
jgi:ribosome-binding ATPase YchF (GTP1/OBG family)